MSDYNLLSDLEGCRQTLAGISTLINYTHIPPAFICLCIGLYLFVARKTISSRLIAAVSLLFTAWVVIDLLLWTSIGSNSLMMFLWSLYGILTSLLFFFIQWFAHAFLTEKPLPRWRWIVWTILIAPIVILTPTTFNLEGFSLHDCAPSEVSWFTNYYYSLGLVAMVFMGISTFAGLRAERNRGMRMAKWIVSTGAQLFVLVFLVTGVVASYLVDSGIVPDFGIEQYGVATMAVFMGLLAYAVVQYHAFKLQMLGAQALVAALLVLVGSEYLFSTNMTNFWLVTVTLVLTAFFGIILVRSVKKEVKQRERIELLAKDLEKANGQQILLIHFITHQIKGFLTKSRNIFAMIKEGDYGEVSADIKPFIEEGFRSDTKGVNTIQEILNAANIKSGKVSYTMAPFDLKGLVDEIGKDLKAAADAKKLALNMDTGTEPLTFTGDRTQLVNAFKNLIDNSIKYTQTGSVNVSLKKEASKIIFLIQDTGVGITPEDMAHLFTEGGHGKDSQKFNVESTGFGLYIVKNIIEAHKGTVRAESEGAGKGSRFVVELPA